MHLSEAVGRGLHTKALENQLQTELRLPGNVAEPAAAD
jgi:hypothetical protein